MFNFSSENAAKTSETGVLAADPHQLVGLLFDSAVNAISNAIYQIEENLLTAKNASITHAILIIESGLRACLNKRASGDLAHNLDILYGYLAKELVLANNNNDINKFIEIKKSLLELRGSWSQSVSEKSQQTLINASTGTPAPGYLIA